MKAILAISVIGNLLLSAVPAIAGGLIYEAERELNAKDCVAVISGMINDVSSDKTVLMQVNSGPPSLTLTGRGRTFTIDCVYGKMIARGYQFDEARFAAQ